MFHLCSSIQTHFFSWLPFFFSFFCFSWYSSLSVSRPISPLFISFPHKFAIRTMSSKIATDVKKKKVLQMSWSSGKGGPVPPTASPGSSSTSLLPHRHRHPWGMRTTSPASSSGSPCTLSTSLTFPLLDNIPFSDLFQIPFQFFPLFYFFYPIFSIFITVFKY